MNSKFYVLIITVLFVFFGCSNKDIYGVTQPRPNDVIRCVDVPESQYKRCMEKGMSYEGYEKARKEVLGEEES